MTVVSDLRRVWLRLKQCIRVTRPPRGTTHDLLYERGGTIEGSDRQSDMHLTELALPSCDGSLHALTTRRLYPIDRERAGFPTNQRHVRGGARCVHWRQGEGRRGRPSSLPREGSVHVVRPDHGAVDLHPVTPRLGFRRWPVSQCEIPAP